ncbi:toxin co-regulated pilus biosynthesis Q family protein [Massilia violaceinigra]|uniref:Toxin co-regulated pilus biosynthesis Q family protein n=1 Tax=Massilia violaceinigra TaxID=2045208 RepID=A0ABY4A4F1_9BURK|nr:toxin co-regulated pilus biosynthesis Q family protein [Massilia violaceinigra]UOD29660.1 toxin co-regulated pilus biosynthesis Q family protein [Massilia violaceinigra]
MIFHSRPGVLFWLGACMAPLAAAGTSAALPPGYAQWIDAAGSVSEPLAMRPALAAAPAPQAPIRAPQSWHLRVGDQTVKAALVRWAASEAWELVWEAPVDYAVERDTAISGSFEQAIEAVAHSMAGAETPLQAIFYKANRVVRIVVRGTPA